MPLAGAPAWGDGQSGWGGRQEGSGRNFREKKGEVGDRGVQWVVPRVRVGSGAIAYASVPPEKKETPPRLRLRRKGNHRTPNKRAGNSLREGQEANAVTGPPRRSTQSRV